MDDQISYSKVGQYRIGCLNSREFHELKREIFGRSIYFFENDNKEPIILDIGAYVGLSTFYFKENYPDAKIVALEPNPIAFKLLELNVSENQLSNVMLLNKALSTNSGVRPLFVDTSKRRWFSTASFVKNSWRGVQDTTSIDVQTMTLAELLSLVELECLNSGELLQNKSIDLLKLDVEGIEQKILLNSAKLLKLFRNIIVEFHPTRGQLLSKVTSLLESYDFVVNVVDGPQKLKLIYAKQKSS